MTKNQVFGYKFYPNPENFTPSRMVWMVTFSKSAWTFRYPWDTLEFRYLLDPLDLEVPFGYLGPLITF